ncbi:MAG: thioredoxin [Ruminococcus sp.]|nr:thioredoxin [Ruminococcus sp.]MCM1392703.1 thioredoxin [Ruminococcus sp.]
MSYIDVNDDNFDEEVLQSEIPVLVDFWAPWCQFCLMIAPDVEEVADELDGKVKVCKLNCDEARDRAIELGISSIPALLLFKNGEVKDSLVGIADKRQILDFISNNQ